RIPRHWSVCGEDARLSLWSLTTGMNVSEINAPLLPSRRDQVGSNEAQQGIAMPGFAFAEQHICLIHAINWAVRRQCTADDVGKCRHKIHYRKHCVRGTIRLDVTRTANDRAGSYCAFGNLAEFAPERTG